MSQRPVIVALVLSSLTITVTHGLPAGEPTSDVAQTVDESVADLAHRDYRVRRRAERRLLAAGPAAIDPVLAVVESGTLETVQRGCRVLERLYASHRLPVSGAAETALRRLSMSERAAVRMRARRILRLHHRAADPRIAAWVFDLGGAIEVVPCCEATDPDDGRTTRIPNGASYVARSADDLPQDAWLITGVNLLDAADVTDDDLPSLARLDGLRCLVLDGTQVTTDGLEHLAAIERLEYLSLRRAAVDSQTAERLRRRLPDCLVRHGPVTDEHELAEWFLIRGARVGLSIGDERVVDFESLPPLPPQPFTIRRLIDHRGAVASVGDEHADALDELEHLTLAGAEVTDRDLEAITDLSRLRWLDLSGTRVTDDGLRALKRLPKLRHLYLSDTAIGDRGLGHLASLQHLEALWIDGTRVTDEGLAQLETSSRLWWLNLARTDIGDTGLRTLERLSNLHSLDCRGTRVTDAGLRSLSTLRRLRSVQLGDTSVTPAGAAALQRRLPETAVFMSLDR